VVGDLAVAFGGLDYTDGYVTTALAPGEGAPGTRTEEAMVLARCSGPTSASAGRAVSLAR
jgi:adenosylcobinamide amidohydrolase